MIHVGNALEILQTLPSNSVDCCVTSPPYWALRDYGVAGQIGLEKTPEEWRDKLVETFREVRRVLKPSGTLWLNLGDCYITHPHGYGPSSDPKYKNGRDRSNERLSLCNRQEHDGLKQKDLVGQPWMMAFALRADGWYLRRDIIWHKPNAMPESCKDRPTTAHEYVFLLSKSEQYFYDHFAVMEPTTGNAHSRGSGVNPKAVSGWQQGPGSHKAVDFQVKREGKNSRFHLNRDARHPKARQNSSFSAAVAGVVAKRACRSVWSIPTSPYRGAHFATFPPRLAERCILAGTSDRGCCSMCGAPWVRTLGRALAIEGRGSGNKERKFRGQHGGNTQDSSRGHSGFAIPWNPSCPQTSIWKPSCACTLSADPIPAVVLDPFAGAGTTLLVAERLGRQGIGIEINPEYARMAEERIRAERKEVA